MKKYKALDQGPKAALVRLRRTLVRLRHTKRRRNTSPPRLHRDSRGTCSDGWLLCGRCLPLTVKSPIRCIRGPLRTRIPSNTYTPLSFYYRDNDEKQMLLINSFLKKNLYLLNLIVQWRVEMRTQVSNSSLS